MPSDGSMCTLIQATNLGTLYDWSCDVDDCRGGIWSLEPAGGGTCVSNTLLTISITDVALQGTLPATFGTVDRPLNSIELQMNDLTGTIPSNIGTIHTTLSYLDLSDNMLSGAFNALYKCSGYVKNFRQFRFGLL